MGGGLLESSEKQTSVVTPAPPGLASMMEAQDTVAARRRDYQRRQESKERREKQLKLEKEQKVKQ